LSVESAFSGQGDITLGNVVGSNLVNLLSVLGLSSIDASNGLSVAPAALMFNIPLMIAVAPTCAPILSTGT
jgi:cation:H+ antiporter